MAFTYGFYNSYKGDRKYNAEQVSEIFDGILKDGIIPSQGQLFDVNTANNGMQITVGTGRAWFDHTWSKNDSVMILNVPQSDITRPRYDAVVLEVNHEQNVRANAIKIVSGVAAVNAAKPILLNTDKVKQYPLAYILVPAGATAIRAEDIENMVGRTPTVFATGVLETVAIDDLWSQWEGEWHTWFEGIKLQLSGDIVTNLQYQIDQLKDKVELHDAQLAVIGIKSTTYTDVITSSQTWKNTKAFAINAVVRCIGGGGGGGGSGSGTLGNGGGGGHMATSTIKIEAGQSVSITIGQGGSAQNNGGTTSFGTYLSANGGGAPEFKTETVKPVGMTTNAQEIEYCEGGSGGTGGGGDVGGTGSYGGGGGGNSRPTLNGNNYGRFYLPSKSGGNGGTYGGGGGGGGCLSQYNSTQTTEPSGGITMPAGTGGTGGTNCGRGGNSGTLKRDWLGYKGSSGGSGVNTTAMDLEFKGTGAGGAGANAIKGGVTSGTYGIVYAGGGGGGGGYGGIGGAGEGHGGGGGGGGYGANGGAAAYTLSPSTELISYAGGGGGYGGKGGDAYYQGTGYGAGGSSGGGGGGGYGVSPVGTKSTNGVSGAVIITYTVTELVVNQ